MVRVTSLALPDQPSLRIDLGPDSLGSVDPGNYQQRNLDTQNQKHIKIYLKETGVLVGDTNHSTRK